MKAGVTTSVVAHAALLIVAIVGLGSAKPLQPPVVESIAVDLVPISDITNIRQGSLTSTVVKTDTPAVVKTDKPAEVAQKTGNTDQDQPKPEETDKQTPAPTVNTAPKPVEAPQPKPEPDPVKEPTPDPQPVAAPTPAPAPAEAQPQQEVAAPKSAEAPATQVAPMPASKPSQLQSAPAKPKPDPKPADVTPKQTDTPKKQTEQAKTPTPQAAKVADAIDQIINSEKSRGATTGAGGDPTLGKTTGRSATLSTADLGALTAAMKECFSPPAGAMDEAATARLIVKLSPDGMVVGQPTIISVTGPRTGDMTGRAAVRAVLRCGQNGYKMLPPDKYAGDGGWNTVDVTFNVVDAG